jgi:putative ATPase
MHIRNAPTRLMKELGYNRGYQYAHDSPDAFIPQEYLPDELRGTEFYTPGPFGFEKEIAKRLAWWQSLRERSAARDGGAPPDRASRADPAKDETKEPGQESG